MSNLKFKSIIFLAPYGKKPSGGVRVLYNLSKFIKQRMPYNSEVLQLGGALGYKNGTESNEYIKYLPENSHIIIPDVFLSRIDANILSGKAYSVIIQNPYILNHVPRFSNENILANIKNAKNVFTISKDTTNFSKNLGVFDSNIHRLKWHLDDRIIELASNFNTIKKQNIITYMPRKCLNDIKNFQLFESYIYQKTGYLINPIKNVPFELLCQNLLTSKIFISFSSFEGFAAPPIEAMVLGNLVTGYHGNGNRDLTCDNNFHFVEQQDILSLVEKICALISESFNEKSRRIYLRKFSKENVEIFNLESFSRASFDVSKISLKDLKLPTSRSSTVIDCFLNRKALLLNR